jgi:hypothetical protein
LIVRDFENARSRSSAEAVEPPAQGRWRSGDKADTGFNGQGGDLELKRWYLITYVIDSDKQECRMYLDADLKKTMPLSGDPRLMRSGQTLTIGNTGAREFMDGVIDDVRIWKHALTDEQVKKLLP